jgi:hypothetical protein
VDVKLGLSRCGRNTSLRVLEKRALRKIFELMRQKVIEGSKELHDESFKICPPHPMSSRLSN